MAFCNACGANLTPGAKFCNKCGVTVADTPAAAPAATPAPPASTGGSALRIILIVVGVIVVVGILGLVTLGVIARHFITHNVHVTQDGNKAKLETPFGTLETNKDPTAVARDLGVDIYPGAQIENNSSASTTFGSVHTIAASFDSSDSLDKVCAYYKSKFPNAMVSTSDSNHCAIISNDQKNMITINVEVKGDGTKIQITNVSGIQKPQSAN